MTAFVTPLQALCPFKSISIYDILKYIPVYVTIDVGAAAGATVKEVKKSAPHATSICFEPFPGNWPFFEKTVQGMRGVVLHKKAVYEEAGVRRFVVPSVVKGDEKNWETMIGYSSGGRISSDPASPDQVIEVDCIRLDEIVRQHVSFLKIDVQGGEFSVLKSGLSLIKRQFIDIIYCEYSGQENICAMMSENEYVIFDTDFLIVGTESELGSLSPFMLQSKKNLSNGRVASVVRFSKSPREIGAYEEFVRAQKYVVAALQTDLIFVSRRFMPTFLNALARINELS